MDLDLDLALVQACVRTATISPAGTTTMIVKPAARQITVQRAYFAGATLSHPHAVAKLQDPVFSKLHHTRSRHSPLPRWIIQARRMNARITRTMRAGEAFTSAMHAAPQALTRLAELAGWVTCLHTSAAALPRATRFTRILPIRPTNPSPFLLWPPSLLRRSAQGAR